MNLRVNFDFGLQQRDILAHAAVLLEAGEGEKAKQVLRRLRPELVSSAQDAVIATEMFLDVHLLESALAAVQRAGELDRNHPEVADLHAECRYRLDLPTIWQSECREIRGALERLDVLAATRPTTTGSGHVHIVCKLDTIGGSERRALNLHRELAAHMPTTLWSTVPCHPAHAKESAIQTISADAAPRGGTLVLIGTYYECGEWFERGRFDRVVICHNLVGQNQSLLSRLRQLENNPAHPRVQLTFPSNMFRDLLGLPGDVEYTAVDLAHFRRTRPHAPSATRPTVGRHGRAYMWKFHPNDAAFFRGLLARGYPVRLLGGTAIERTFSRDTIARPELIEVGAIGAREFLDGLDVFVFRKHPQLVESGGAVILEAMAMELPVVVFPERCGCAELIRHGENGFLVASEAEAYDVIERLHAEPELRSRIGVAARQTLVDLQSRQEPEVLARYRGEPQR